jgi:hypothetical protein
VSAMPVRDIFKIDLTNVRGLNANFESVEYHVGSCRPDVMVLTETQIAHFDRSYDLGGYNAFPNTRLNGGVVAYVHSSIPASPLTEVISPLFDDLWLRIVLPTSSFIVGMVYCSPNNTNYAELFAHLSACHDVYSTLYPNSSIIYLGDFNVHHAEWLHSGTTDVGGRLALDFAEAHNLSQLIDEPTRVPDRPDHRCNTLDLFLTSIPDSFRAVVLAPLGKSDHCLISVTHRREPTEPYRAVPRRIWHYDRADWGAMAGVFRGHHWPGCFATGDASVAAAGLAEIILDAMNVHVPHIDRFFSSRTPWFSPACARAVKSRDAAFRLYKRTLSPLSHANFIILRNRCKTITRNAKRSFIIGKCDLLVNESSGKSFWSLYKNISSNFCKSSIPPLINTDNDALASSPLEKAELLGASFAANSTITPGPHPPPPTHPSHSPPQTSHSRAIC